MNGSGTLVLTFGNPLRRDDGAGHLVARALRERGIAGVEIRHVAGDAAGLAAAWEGYERVILVDAVESGASPGSLHRVDATERPLPARWRSPSTHAFGPLEGIELARALGRLPASLLVYAIEGSDFREGDRPSVPVAGAAAAAVKRILEDLAPTP